MLQVTRKLVPFLLIIFALFLIAQPALAQWGTEFFESTGKFVTGADTESIIVRVVTWMMDIIAFLALAFIVYGAIRYVTSAGNEQQIAQAKKILIYAIVGLVIAILAIVIINVVAGVTGEGGEGVGEGEEGEEGVFYACGEYEDTCEFFVSFESMQAALDECYLWCPGLGCSCFPNKACSGGRCVTP